MKSRSTRFDWNVSGATCRQACSACVLHSFVSFKNLQTAFDPPRQLYAKEVEEYFFYFNHSFLLDHPKYAFTEN